MTYLAGGEISNWPGSSWVWRNSVGSTHPPSCLWGAPRRSEPRSGRRAAAPRLVAGDVAMIWSIAEDVPIRSRLTQSAYFGRDESGRR